MTKLRTERERVGLTQAELAALAGVTRARIGQVEGGDSAPLELRVRIARALERPLHEVFPVDDAKAPA